MVKLADIIDAIETANDNWLYFLDRRTNEVKYYDYNNKDLNDFEPDEEDIDIYIKLPSEAEIDEYSMMTDYAESKGDERLLRLLNGRGAFRRFRNAVDEDDWFKYRDQRYREIAISWCEEHELEYE